MKTAQNNVPATVGTGAVNILESSSHACIARGLLDIAEILDADYCCKKGQAFLDSDEYKQAIFWFEKALRINQVHEKALFGNAYAFLHETEECFKSDPAQEHIFCLENSVRLFEKLIGLGDHRKYYGLGMLYINLSVAKFRLNSVGDAMHLIWKAIELDPKDPCAWSNLAAYTDNLPKEEQYALKAIEADGEYSHAYYVLGLIYKRQQRYREAFNAFCSFLSFADEKGKSNQRKIARAKAQKEQLLDGYRDKIRDRIAANLDMLYAERDHQSQEAEDAPLFLQETIQILTNLEGLLLKEKVSVPEADEMLEGFLFEGEIAF